jgi:hypothetical protein
LLKPVCLILAAVAAGNVFAACPRETSFKGTYAGAGVRYNTAGSTGLLITPGLFIINFDGLGNASRRGVATLGGIEKNQENIFGIPDLGKVATGATLRFSYTYNAASCIGRIDAGQSDNSGTVYYFSLTDNGLQLVGAKYADDPSSDGENIDSHSFTLRKQ